MKSQGFVPSPDLMLSTYVVEEERSSDVPFPSSPYFARVSFFFVDSRIQNGKLKNLSSKRTSVYLLGL